MGKRYLRMENQKLRRGLVRNQEFAEGTGLEPKVKMSFKNMLKLGRCAGQQANVT